jgi:hypothetical protein
MGPLDDATVGGGFGDFAVDTLSISSYNDAGQYPGYEGSVLAHGTVDNLTAAAPLPVAGLNPLVAGQVQFQSDTNWTYTLEQTANLKTWSAAAPAVCGNGAALTLQATNPPAAGAFYRVRADLP